MVDRTLRPIVPVEHANEREHRRLLANRVNATLTNDGTNAMVAPLAMASYTEANLPDPSLTPGAIVYVSDTQMLAVSDGTSWHSSWIEATSVSGGTSGAYLSLYQNSATPAVNDAIGIVKFQGNNASAAKKEFARIVGVLKDTAAGAETGFIGITTLIDGTDTFSRLSNDYVVLLGYNSGGAATNYEHVFRGPAGYTTYMYVESFDSGTEGPSFNLWHNTPSPAVSDNAGSFTVSSGPALYMRIKSHLVTTTPGSEESLLYFENADGSGGLGATMYLGRGFVVGSPSGGDLGSGTANVQNDLQWGGAASTQTTPTVTSGTGTFTTVSSTVNKKQFGKWVCADVIVTVTTIGTAGTYVRIASFGTTPVRNTVFAGYNPQQGYTANGVLGTDGKLTIFRYDGLFPIAANGDTLVLHGMIEVA